MRSEGKEGVAIIIVLGLLGLLMVLGVAFSVSMRVERAGAANYASLAKNQQLVWAGLARAISDIHESLGTDVFPPGDFLASGSGGWGAVPGGGIRLLGGSATNFVPDLFLELGYQEQPSGWIPMGTGAGRQGYAAYMVLNLSEMLDLMHVGGETRAGGTEPGELVLDSIGVDGDDLQTARNDAGPFETLAEFKALYPGISARALTAYSRFLAEEQPEGITPVNLSGSLADLQSQAGDIGVGLFSMVRDVLPDSVPAAVEGDIRRNTRRFVLANLYQYIDNDGVPAQLTDGPCFKKVPMLNEIYYDTDGIRFQTWRFDIQLRIETWYPFYDADNAPEATVTGLADIAIAVTLDDGSTYAATNANMDIESTVPAGEAFHEGQIRLRGEFPDVPASTNDRPMTLAVRLHDLQIEETGTPVDRIDAYIGFRTPPGTIVTPDGTVAGIQFTNQAWEVADPRLNWSSDHWVSSDTPTPEAINGATLQVWSDHPEREHAYPVYASNEQQFYSPLELGNLLLPDHENEGAFSPWKTFRVFNRFDGSGNIVEDRHRMLTYFTANTNTVRRGLVHLNSIEPDIIHSAFEGIPVPGPTGGTPVPTNITREIADMLVDYREANEFYGEVAGMLDINWRRGTLQDLPDITLNALAAYSSGLLGVRQNLFLIVVAGASGSEGMGEQAQGRVTYRGRQRAIALVWRDPVPNAEGLHDCFVRMFKWLD